MLRMPGPPGQQLERVWRNGHFQRVMFRCPDNFKSGLIGHFDHREGVVTYLVHIGIRRHALQIYGELEFHSGTPYSSRNKLFSERTVLLRQRGSNGLATGSSLRFIHTVLGRV